MYYNYLINLNDSSRSSRILKRPVHRNWRRGARAYRPLLIKKLKSRYQTKPMNCCTTKRKQKVIQNESIYLDCNYFDTSTLKIMSYKHILCSVKFTIKYVQKIKRTTTNSYILLFILITFRTFNMQKYEIRTRSNQNCLKLSHLVSTLQ